MSLGLVRNLNVKKQNINFSMNVRNIEIPMIRSLLAILLINLPLFADNCITYQNMSSSPLNGELFEVTGTRYWDHGEKITYYIFHLEKETCFDDGDGPINTDQIHVILNDEQLNDLNNLVKRKIKIQINDFLWGGTQHWKRSIGVRKAKFIKDPS